MRARFLAFALCVFAAGKADAAQWQVDPAKSKLGFSIVWSHEPLQAAFKKWTADIAFDPADLAHAKASVIIDIASLVSEDPQNDKYRNGPNGFDVAHWREARFVTKNIRSLSPGHYEASADLTIHGVTKAVSLPFTLAINGNAAHMVGQLTLSRIDFGIGSGNLWGIDWTSARTVAHAVKVTVDLTATRKS